MLLRAGFLANRSKEDLPPSQQIPVTLNAVHRRGTNRAALSVLLFSIDLALLASAGFAASLSDPDQLAMPGLLSSLLIIWFLQQRHYTVRRSCWTAVKQIMTGIAVMAVITGWAYLFFRPQAMWEALYWAYALVLLILARFVTQAVGKAVRRSCCATLLVGSSEMIETMRALVSEHLTRCEIRESILASFDDDLLVKIESQLERHPDLGYVLFGLDSTSTIPTGDALRFLDEARIPYGLMPPVSNISNFQIERFLGCDFVVLQRDFPVRPNWINRATKRFIDIIGSIFILLLVAPALATVALILSSQGGPVLYRSRRLGQHNKVFLALKFRTMRPDADDLLSELLSRDSALQAEWQANYKLQRDPRVTKFGRFLRCTSLDELPQLINVLRGDMSLVGPRPLLLEEVPRHQGSIHLYKSMRPGITGLWQVSGRNDLDYRRRMQLNNWYVSNWTLWYDVIILLKTISVVLRRRGAL